MITAVNEMEVSKYQHVTHTHTDREQQPRYTHTHDKNKPTPPNEHPPQTLNNARRWRDDGTCHLPRPGGWPRMSTAVNGMEV